MTDGNHSAPKRSRVEVRSDRAISALAELNPDELDQFVHIFWNKKPRTARLVLEALQRPIPNPEASGIG